MKKYICIKGSPEIPKGSEAIEFDLSIDPYMYTYNVIDPCGITIYSLRRSSVEQNDCWEEVKEETRIPVKRWKPEYGEGYWYYIIDGNIISDHWEGTMLDNKMYSVGNIFRTEKEAKAEVMRMKSRAGRWDFVPKKGNSYWCYEFYYKEVKNYSWNNDTVDYAIWNMGNCHRSEADANKWGETYAQYFLPPQN